MSWMGIYVEHMSTHRVVVYARVCSAATHLNELTHSLSLSLSPRCDNFHLYSQHLVNGSYRTMRAFGKKPFFARCSTMEWSAVKLQKMMLTRSVREMKREANVTRTTNTANLLGRKIWKKVFDERAIRRSQSVGHVYVRNILNARACCLR